jgi:hypothetical protein
MIQMTQQQTFLNLRPQMLNEQCRDCFDILSPHFPAITHDSPVMVNLQSGYRSGGTGMYNYNMLPEEALSAVDTLKEIGCPCLFVVPVPVSGLFTEEYLGVGTGSSSYAHRILEHVRAGFIGEWVKFPPYFSIHMVGATYKPECRTQLRELLIQNLHVRKPQAFASAEQDAAKMLKKFTLCSK